MACPNPSVDDMLPSLAVLSRAVLISWVVTLCCMHLACTNKTISPAGSSNAITSQEAVGQSQKVCLDTLYAICELAEDDPCSLDRPEERAQLYSIALQQMGLYDPDQEPHHKFGCRGLKPSPGNFSDTDQSAGSRLIAGFMTNRSHDCG